MPLNAVERIATGRIALRITPPPETPALVLHPGAQVPSTSARTAGGALEGAIGGTSDVVHGLSDSDAPLVAFALLLPLAMVTGAIVGALAATVDDHTLAASARTSSTTPADTNTQFDTLNSQLAGGLTDMNIESVDHTTSDQELLQEGFASVIDVVLYAPVVAGKTHRSSFVLLHKMRARSLIGAFDTRTWYREQVSNTRPVYDWFANDNRAIQAQLLILQVNLLHDLQRVFGDAPTEIIR